MASSPTTRSTRSVVVRALDDAQQRAALEYRAAAKAYADLQRDHADVLRQIEDARRRTNAASDDLRTLDKAITYQGELPLDDDGNPLSGSSRTTFETVRANRENRR